MAPPFTPLYIDGEWRPASTGATYDVTNPLTGAVVGTAAAASAADCVAAVEAAQRAFKTWESTPAGVRRDIVLRAADILATERYRDKILEACATETCAACGARAHDAAPCPVDASDGSLLRAAGVAGWQQCPACLAVVMKSEGCRHIM